VLIGYTKTGFGTGQVVAPGWHVEPEESAAEGRRRERSRRKRASAWPPASLTAASRLTFHMHAQPSWDMDVAISPRRDWRCEPAESEAIRPEWFRVGSLQCAICGRRAAGCRASWPRAIREEFTSAPEKRPSPPRESPRCLRCKALRADLTHEP